MTLGFKGDETRALDRYIKEQDDIFFVPPKNYKETPEYQAILADERNKEREFAEDNPVADFTARLGGGLVTGGAVSRAFGVGKSFAEGAARQGGAGGLEGFLYGFNEGDGDLSARLESGGRMGLATGSLGGALGGIGGRMEGNAIKHAKEVEDLEKRRKARVQLNKPTSDSNEVWMRQLAILARSQKITPDRLASRLRAQSTGRRSVRCRRRLAYLPSVCVTQRLRQAEKLLTSARRLLRSCVPRISKLADETGFTGDGYNPSKIERWVTKSIRPLAKHGEKGSVKVWRLTSENGWQHCQEAGNC